MELPEPLYTPEPVAAEPVQEEPPITLAAAANGSSKHEPLFDDLDVPAILRKRMVQ
jgi:hypothetical protein